MDVSISSLLARLSAASISVPQNLISGFSGDADQFLQELVRNGVVEQGQADVLASNQRIPLRFGDFLVKSLLDSGAMGTVYRAVQQSLHDRPVALKVIPTNSPDSLVAAQEEVAALSALPECEHLVTTYTSGVEGGYFFIAMELVTGTSLSDDVQSRTKYGIKRALQTLRGIATGLKVAHREGIIHRDIKPDNILISGSTPKLCDWGIADIVGNEKLLADIKTKSTSNLRGTPIYMAPEQFEDPGNEASEKSDIYSMGLCLYYMLTGKAPYEGKIGSVVAQKVQNWVPSLPSDVIQRLPEIEDLYHKMVCPEAHRKSDVDSILDQAQRLIDLYEASASSGPLGEMSGDSRSDTTLATIERLLESHGVNSFGHKLTKADCLRWVRNFASTDVPLALKLLDVLLTKKFISRDTCKDCANVVMTQFRKSASAASKLIVAPLMRDSLGQHILGFITEPDVDVYQDIESIPRIGASQSEILLIAGFCFSGDSTARWLRRQFSTERQNKLAEFRHVSIAFFMSEQRGRTKVAQALRQIGINCRIIEYRTIRPDDHAYAMENPYFTANEKDRLRVLSHQLPALAMRLGVTAPLEPDYLIATEFHVPFQSLPLIWYSDNVWSPLLPQARNVGRWIPSTPYFCSRDAQIDRLTELVFDERKHVCVSGENGHGKTYLVASFANQLINQKIPSKQTSVFWHTLSSAGTFQDVVENICSHFRELNRGDVVELLQEARHDPQRFAVALINSTGEEHLLIFDRIEFATKDTGIETMLRTLLSEPTTQSPSVIVIGNHGIDSVAADWHSVDHIARLPVKPFCDAEARQQVMKLWYVARSNDESIPALSTEQLNDIVEIGLNGDPLVTGLATSYALSVRNQARVSETASEIKSTRHERPAIVFKYLWNQLSDDARLYIAVASCAVSPRFRLVINRFTDAIATEFHHDLQPWEDTFEELRGVCSSIFSLAGHGENELVLIPDFTRKLVLDGLDSGTLKLPQGVTLKGIFRCLADVVASGELQELPQLTSETCLLHANHYLDCAGEHVKRAKLILSKRDAIEHSIQLGAFAKILDQISREHDMLLAEQGVLIPTIKAVFRLYRRMTRHDLEMQGADFWLQHRRGYADQSLKLMCTWHRATSVASFGRYRECLKLCAEIIEEVSKLESSNLLRQELELRAMARSVQTNMSLDQFETAWNEVSQLVANISRQIDTNLDEFQTRNLRHTLAVAIRHIATLYFLCGKYEESIRWCTFCREVNLNANEVEGVAIASYKLARCIWLKDESISLGDVMDAIAYSTDAYKRLRPEIFGNIWWKLCLLEQLGSLHIAAAKFPKTDRDHHLKEASDNVNIGLDLLDELDKRSEDTSNVLLIKQIEFYLLRAKLEGEHDRPDECFGLFETIKDELPDQGMGFLKGLVDFEWAFYLSKFGKHEAAIETCWSSIKRSHDLGIPQASVAFLRRGIYIAKRALAGGATGISQKHATVMYVRCSHLFRILRQGDANGTAERRDRSFFDSLEALFRSFDEDWFDDALTQISQSLADCGTERYGHILEGFIAGQKKSYPHLGHKIDQWSNELQTVLSQSESSAIKPVRKAMDEFAKTHPIETVRAAISRLLPREVVLPSPPNSRAKTS